MRNSKDSVRKQNWKFNLAFPKPPKPEPTTHILTDEEIDAMFWLGKTSRNLMKRDATKKRKEQEAKGMKIKTQEWGNGSNVCDYSHDTAEEIRRLPTSAPDPQTGSTSAALVCKNHYFHEMAYRRERNRTLEPQNRFPIPEWESLEIVQEAETPKGANYHAIHQD